MISSIYAHYAGTFYHNIANESAQKDTSAISNPNDLPDTATPKATSDHPILSEIAKQQDALVSVKTVPDPSVHNAERSLDQWANHAANHVVIAPRILAQMAQDPEAKSYYLNQIHSYFQDLKKLESYLAMSGRKIVSSGVIIHEDGAMSAWSFSDYTPEEITKIRLKMLKRAKEKRKKSLDQEYLRKLATKRYQEQERLRQQANERYLEQERMRKLASEKLREQQQQNQLAYEKLTEQNHQLLLSFLRHNEQDVRIGLAYERRKLSVDYFKIMK